MGYLSLDIFAYADPIMTFLIPALLLIFGSIPLPGGAVMIMTSRLRDRKWESFTALAGPIANLSFAIGSAFGLPFIRMLIGPGRSYEAALSAMCLLQLQATFLNLLPIIPFDGWRVLSPWLSGECFLKKLESNEWHRRSLSLIGLLAAFAVFRIPVFGYCMGFLLSSLQVDPHTAVLGLESLRFRPV
eukprot:Trichotokara_eunicae@DN5953_c0_g2_i1.p1